MSKLWLRLRNFAGKLFRIGFFSVFFSNVLCKVLTFIGGMIIVRVLSKGDYGAYSYVINCYGMQTLAKGFQFLHHFTENPATGELYVFDYTELLRLELNL